MLTLFRGAAFAAALTASAFAQNLTADQWQEDISAAAEAIKSSHPDPFRKISAQEFDATTEALINDVDALSDKEIALRLARLVALIDDGHTRLSLPRTHTAFAYNTGHTGPDAAAHEALSFTTLPFRFYVFEDGLFIVEAASEYKEFLGAEVIAFGETSAKAAIAAVRPILFAENDMGAKVLAADRLALPDFLSHFGIVESSGNIMLTLEQNGARKTISFAPLAADATLVPEGVSFSAQPLLLQQPDVVKWHKRVPGARAWYIHIDEIEMFPEVLLSDFMADALRQAKRARAKKIILDLRENHGGSASFNASIISALTQSEFNEYGRLFVLIGRETFSAASMLLSDFEQYTNAILVGEPSSARPTSFGDPRKLQLPNSGLTLRVSTLVWQSWLAGDFRDTIETHIDAPPISSYYFAGRDNAIEAALAYSAPQSPAAQMAELFDKDKLQSGLIRFFGWLNAPIDGPHDAVDDLVEYGHAYLDADELQKGRFMMTMARDYFPASADARFGLGRAMELNGDQESARRRYEEALEIDSDHEGAREGLARLVE